MKENISQATFLHGPGTSILYTKTDLSIHDPHEITRLTDNFKLLITLNMYKNKRVR